MRAAVFTAWIILECVAAFARPEPIDREAFPETRSLLTFLDTVRREHVLFGHQNTTLYGVGWTAQGTADSDVKKVTGLYPAVYGWDLGALSDPELETIREHAIAAHQRGGINTFSWHCPNPVTGGNFYDTTPAVRALLPGGDRHAWFCHSLDTVADFFLSLRDAEGKAIPVIFRPWHEQNGNWFWWGTPHFCTPEDFSALWRFTVDYLRRKKSVHNLLYAWSPNKTSGKMEDYFTGYPGDDYADILGLDAYAHSLKFVLPQIRTLVETAEHRQKVPALTETGPPKGLSVCHHDAPFTEGLLAPLRTDPVARRIAWLLVWRNANKDHYWVPAQNDRFVDDFRKFCRDLMIIMGDRIRLKWDTSIP